MWWDDATWRNNLLFRRPDKNDALNRARLEGLQPFKAVSANRLAQYNLNAPPPRAADTNKADSQTFFQGQKNFIKSLTILRNAKIRRSPMRIKWSQQKLLCWVVGNVWCHRVPQWKVWNIWKVLTGRWEAFPTRRIFLLADSKLWLLNRFHGKY